MKYLIKYNNGKDEMFIKNDLAFKGYIELAVVQDKDIKDFHVTVIPDNETVFRCRICGSEIDHETYYCGPQMVERQLCFTCNFWQNQLEADKERGDYKWAVIDGGHYVIAPEDEKTRFRGFDGQKFIIIFEDGTVVKTTNLWFQGHIPKEWKSQFPDNAVFADNRKWQKIGDCECLAPSISTT